MSTDSDAIRSLLSKKGMNWLQCQTQVRNFLLKREIYSQRHSLAFTVKTVSGGEPARANLGQRRES